MKQRSILRKVSIEGQALHTGAKVHLSFSPAEPGEGIVFRRTDLCGKPQLRPSVDLISEVVRSTTLSSGHVKVHTVEHILSALNGLGIDNVLVDINASEPPILDGSAKSYVTLLQEAGIIEQSQKREYYVLEHPVSISKDNRSLIALPYDGFKITCTSTDDRGIHTQHLSLDIDPETYATQIASARTFTIYEDIEELLKMGKIQGGSLDSAVVIKGNKVLSKEPLRFKDEFVRHKILDIIGDVSLLGRPLKAHIVAVRPGHALNAELTRAILECFEKKTKKREVSSILQSETELDTRQILNLLPHRYPFVLVDRVVEIKGKTELVAIKNVTFNEPYFQGHFPGMPVMPGVLQLEAMAQAAGLLMLMQVSSEDKVAFFMSADKVKFRQSVKPGDQLRIEMKLTKSRGNKIGVAEGTCKVNDKIVSSAELMFAIMEASEVDN